jgi:sugar/nucleoside kinase (ribokinase family)
MARPGRLVDARPRAGFDVICAGETVWRAVSLHGGRLVRDAAGAPLLDAARALAQRGFRAGLATVLDDDARGRAARAELAALGVDAGGVALRPPSAALVVVDAVGDRVGALADRGPARDFAIPAGWSSPVLLLSGLSPVTSTAAALCRAARWARRNGTVVVLDAVGGLRRWAGADPRTTSMVIREVDVVSCSLLDLAVLGTDAATVRRTMRPEATLVVRDGPRTTAGGAFGEVRVDLPSRASDDAPERCTAAICGELARPRPHAESDVGRWHRVLREVASVDRARG